MFLMVDDDASFGDSLQFLFQSRGYTAFVFRSAKAFLDSVPSEQKGIAIVDLHMPGCDGFELMDKMRELHYEMPVIVVTGQSQAYSRDEALERGAVGFLQKPFSEQSLLELIEEHETGEGAK
jgi:two-component system response regulator FixJ